MVVRCVHNWVFERNRIADKTNSKAPWATTGYAWLQAQKVYRCSKCKRLRYVDDPQKTEEYAKRTDEAIKG